MSTTPKYSNSYQALWQNSAYYNVYLVLTNSLVFVHFKVSKHPYTKNWHICCSPMGNAIHNSIVRQGELWDSASFVQV